MKAKESNKSYYEVLVFDRKDNPVGTTNSSRKSPQAAANDAAYEMTAEGKYKGKAVYLFCEVRCFPSGRYPGKYLGKTGNKLSE